MASPPPPTPRSGIGVTPTAASGRYATQGMISPTNPAFVDPTTGTLAPVSFRFLHGLFSDIQALQAGGGGGGGTPGPPGPQGPSGPPGPTGSAATVTVGTTTTGTPGTPANVTNSGSTSAATFNFTIPAGVAGATGAAGSQGPQGNPGATGSQGPPGNTGATGAQGPQGDVGATGPQGVPGNTGAQGPPGADGATGAAGPPGATGPQGPNWQVGSGLALNTGTTPNTIAMTSPTPASIAQAGVIDGSNAAAGVVGEYQSVNGSNFTIGSGIWSNLAVLSLTAGDWDIWGLAIFSPSTGQASQCAAGLSNSASGSPSVPFVTVTNLNSQMTSTNLPVLQARFNSATPFTVYGNSYCSFAAGTCTASFNIYARRAR